MSYNAAMTDSEPMLQADLAIIGGGAAGVLVALNALRGATAPVQVVLFEPASTLAQGIAYATPWPEHLLNVPAGKMSGLPEQPGDFVDYLLQADALPGLPRDVLTETFVPRRHYAAYLQHRLAEAQAQSPATLHVVHEPVIALQPGTPRNVLRLAEGQQWQSRQVVLACGNSMRPLPVPGADALPPAWLANACVSFSESDCCVLPT